MESYKNQWLERYKTNAADCPRLVGRPLFDPEGKWRYGAPMGLESEIGWAMVLAMGDAPDELVQACIRRAKDLAEEIDRIDLLNADARHARLESSRISYLRGKVLLGLMEGQLPPLEAWHDLAVLKLQLFEHLEKAPDEKLHAVLYFLLAHEYTEAKKVMDGMRSAKGYETEFSVMKKLAPEMAQNGGKVQSAEVRDLALDFFEQIRNPNPVRKFDKNNLDRFEWALFIAEAIEPGDGHLDAKRAMDMVSR